LRKRAKIEPGESMRVIFLDPRFHLLTRQEPASPEPA